MFIHKNVHSLKCSFIQNVHSYILNQRGANIGHNLAILFGPVFSSFFLSFMLFKIHEEFILNLDQEMRQQVARYAAAMKRMGVQVGDRVAGEHVLGNDKDKARLSHASCG